MAEINNNIPSFGHKFKITHNENNKTNTVETNNTDKTEQKNSIPNNDSVGRSMVNRPNIDADIEALKEKGIEKCEMGEKLFEELRQAYIKNGLSEAEAYTKALLGEEMFYEMLSA